jgi:hypothetical protein
VPVPLSEGTSNVEPMYGIDFSDGFVTALEDEFGFPIPPEFAYLPSANQQPSQSSLPFVGSVQIPSTTSANTNKAWKGKSPMTSSAHTITLATRSPTVCTKISLIQSAESSVTANNQLPDPFLNENDPDGEYELYSDTPDILGAQVSYRLTEEAKISVLQLLGLGAGSTLSNPNWLNDNTISTLTRMFKCLPRVRLFSAGWASTKLDPIAPLNLKPNEDEYDHLIIPVCYAKHWVVFYLDIGQKVSTYYDSMDSTKIGHPYGGVIQGLATRIISEHLGDFDIEWTHQGGICEQQQDCESCGLFVIKNIQNLLLKRLPKLPMSKSDTAIMRIVYIRVLVGARPAHIIPIDALFESLQSGTQDPDIISTIYDSLNANLNTTKVQLHHAFTLAGMAPCDIDLWSTQSRVSEDDHIGYRDKTPSSMGEWGDFSALMGIDQNYEGTLLVSKSFAGLPHPWPVPNYKISRTHEDWAGRLTSLQDGSRVVFYVIGIDGMSTLYRAFMELAMMYANLQFILIIREPNCRPIPFDDQDIWIRSPTYKYMLFELCDFVRNQPQSIEAKLFALLIKKVQAHKYGTPEEPKLVTAYRNERTLKEKTFVCKVPGCSFRTSDKGPFISHRKCHPDVTRWERSLIGAGACPIDWCSSMATTVAKNSSNFLSHLVGCHPTILQFAQKTLYAPCEAAPRVLLRNNLKQFVKNAYDESKVAFPCPLGLACGRHPNNSTQEELLTHMRMFHVREWVDGLARTHSNLVNYFGDGYTPIGPWSANERPTAQAIYDVETLPIVVEGPTYVNMDNWLKWDNQVSEESNEVVDEVDQGVNNEGVGENNARQKRSVSTLFQHHIDTNRS